MLTFLWTNMYVCVFIYCINIRVLCSNGKMSLFLGCGFRHLRVTVTNVFPLLSFSPFLPGAAFSQRKSRQSKVSADRLNASLHSHAGQRGSHVNFLFTYSKVLLSRGYQIKPLASSSVIFYGSFPIRQLFQNPILYNLTNIRTENRGREREMLFIEEQLHASFFHAEKVNEFFVYLFPS